MASADDRDQGDERADRRTGTARPGWWPRAQASGADPFAAPDRRPTGQTDPSAASGAVAPRSSAAEVASFLTQASRIAPPVQTTPATARLMFALDATMSRQPTWDRARDLQAGMFEEAARLGGLAVRLVYFRGLDECRASPWVEDPRRLAGLMAKVGCEGGHTQIRKVLSAAREAAGAGGLKALVYVGDCVEEDIDLLCARAGELALLGVPVFLFQEGSDPVAARAFGEIARLTRGVHLAFDHRSAAELAGLLRAVAAYAAGGLGGLEQLGQRGNAGARLLLSHISPG
ncbi:VWA domain-containing protein [Pannonibacter tanglangensis]|uniref:VWA domain-containing protein n=1 Tax=Pannonibacter tanglangensis TaxID=2750084 RepID=UPI001FCC7306|nr:VWA domain-containing protein [Pannonibacter sp. XCT-34]